MYKRNFDPLFDSGFNLTHKSDMPTGFRVALGSNMIFLAIYFFLKFKSNTLIMLSAKLHADFEFRHRARSPSADVTEI